MKNQLWLTITTETWSHSVVPASACSLAAKHVFGTPMRKRNADGMTAAARKGLGPVLWSPPN